MHNVVRHTVAERTDDVAKIVSAVSAWDQNFALLYPTDRGLHLRVVRP